MDAQSAELRHCPPINCIAFPLPTFFAPAGSKAGPPAEAVPATAAAGAAATLGLDEDPDEPVEPKPQPVFPFCVDAPGPEHIPVGFAQHPLPQSALLKLPRKLAPKHIEMAWAQAYHCPPMNCPPAPLPTFFAPAGSKGGTAYATKATEISVSGEGKHGERYRLRLRMVAIVNDFMITGYMDS